MGARVDRASVGRQAVRVTAWLRPLESAVPDRLAAPQACPPAYISGQVSHGIVPPVVHRVATPSSIPRQSNARHSTGLDLSPAKVDHISTGLDNLAARGAIPGARTPVNSLSAAFIESRSRRAGGRECRASSRLYPVPPGGRARRAWTLRPPAFPRAPSATAKRSPWPSRRPRLGLALRGSRYRRAGVAPQPAWGRALAVPIRTPIRGTIGS